MSKDFLKIARRRRAWVCLVVFVALVFAVSDAAARGRGGGRGGSSRGGAGGFSRGGSGRSAPTSRQQPGGTNRTGSRAGTRQGSPSAGTQRSGDRQQTDRDRGGERTQRTEDRTATRGDRNEERTERTGERQGERTERTSDRQEGLNERQDDRQDFYEDNRWSWGNYHHQYYGAGAIWAGLVIGASIAALPRHHEVIVVTGTTYYYSSGVYYVPASSGTTYMVVEAPAGATVQQLPEQTINVNVNVSGDTVQYANGAYYEEQAPAADGTEPGYKVVEPPQGATVPYVPEGAVEKKIGGETYFVAGNTYYKAFYSGSDVVYMVTANPEG